MYTLPKGQSKIVGLASARRGPPRQLDFEGYDTRDKFSRSSRNGDVSSDKTAEMSNPRPIFQQRRTNNRRSASLSSQDPPVNRNHLDMAHLLNNQWQKVQESLAKAKDGDIAAYEIYREKDTNRKLENFQPFDLEKFWGTRTLTNALGGKSPS